jgi:TonB family protein
MKLSPVSFVSLLLTFALSVSGTAKPGIESDKIDLQFDVTAEPEFPLRLRNEGLLEGTASVVVVVDRDGQLRDFLLLEASHVMLGEAVMKVVPDWKFTPPTQNGQPINAAHRINFIFDSHGAVISVFGFDAFIQRHPGYAATTRTPFRHEIVPPRQLDQLPVPLRRIDPAAPPLNSLHGQPQRVVFSFFIDQAGRVRIPLPIESPDHPIDEFLLDSVHNALVQWQFTPPTLDGKPVITQVNQPFDFLPRNPAALPSS